MVRGARPCAVRVCDISPATTTVRSRAVACTVPVCRKSRLTVRAARTWLSVIDSADRTEDTAGRLRGRGGCARVPRQRRCHGRWLPLSLGRASLQDARSHRDWTADAGDAPPPPPSGSTPRLTRPLCTRARTTHTHRAHARRAESSRPSTGQMTALALADPPMRPLPSEVGNAQVSLYRGRAAWAD